MSVQPGPQALDSAGVFSSIHRAAFAACGQRGWSQSEITDLLRRETTLVISVDGGFLLAGIVLDEAEILTLAVDPTRHRQGQGRAMLLQLLSACTSRGVSRCLLEVAADNHAATTLYTTTGFTEIGTRPRYFKRGNGSVAAIMMEKVITRQ